MSDFLQILNDYKEIIVSCAVFLLVLLAILLKKRPKTLDDFKFAVSEALNLVPSLVIKVERPSNGAEKKSQVIDACLVAVSSYLGRPLTDSEKSYVRKEADITIEGVLSTPKKKIC